MSNNALLAFGNFRRAERIDLSVLAQEASLEVCFTEKTSEAAEWLEHNTPRVLLVDDRMDEAAQVCQVTRSRLERASVPIISVAQELDDLTFEEVFSWGGDDAVGLSSLRPLLSRVRALPAELTAPTPSRKGKALVADPDRARRLVRARVLRNAGYSVSFAVSAEDAIKFAQDADSKLVVIDLDLDDSLLAIEGCRATNSEANLVILCPPKRSAEITECFAGFPNVAVSDSYAPPENVLFIVNELARGGASDKRASKRLLFGTQVAFRGEGRAVDDVGFTYNISAGGFYVRTLAPPVEDHVWLELQPPRADRRVRLEGEVVWRRPFGPSEFATVPPGFGVRIADATRRNLAAWLQGYNDFGAAIGLAPSLPRSS
jgi:CheY-like chemotaxis protein